LWYIPISTSTNGKCESKSYFNCNSYHDYETCSSDTIVYSAGGCDWFPTRTEGLKCQRKVTEGSCHLFGKVVCNIDGDRCHWDDGLGGCGSDYYIKTSGSNTGICPSESPCLTLDYVMNYVNVSGSANAIYIDKGTYNYGYGGSSSNYFFDVSFNISGMTSSEVSADDVNTYPIINLTSGCCNIYVFYFRYNCISYFQYLKFQFCSQSYSSQRLFSSLYIYFI
jgi:hypothetical protein